MHKTFHSTNDTDRKEGGGPTNTEDCVNVPIQGLEEYALKRAKINYSSQ